MSITVQNRFLRVRDCVGEGKASAILQDTLELPGDFPDVERVIAAHAVPRNVDAVTGEGRAVVRGAVDVRLLYAALALRGPRGADEPEESPAEPIRLVLAEFTEACPFEVTVDLPGVSPGLKVKTMVAIESVNVSLVNRRRLGLDVALVVTVRVCEDQEVRAAVDATVLPPERVRCVKEMVHVEHLAAEAMSRLKVEMSLATPPEEPPVVEVLWAVPHLHHVLGRTGEGKAFVEGIVDVDVVFLTGDPAAPVRGYSWLDAHRFAGSFDLPGVRPGMMLMVDLEVEGVACFREAERCLTVVVEAKVRAHARHAMDLALVTDAVSEGGEQLDVVRKAVRFPHHLAEGHREATVGGVLSLPPTKPPLECVIWTGAVYIPDRVEMEDDRVLVEGDLSLKLLYQAAGPEATVHQVEFPRALRLSQVVEVPGSRPGMTAHAEVHVHAVDVRLVDPETVQVDVVVHLHVVGLAVVQVEVVVECLVVAPCPPGTTLRMVVVQPGDTLWKLSRRYGVSLDAVIKANPQIPNPDLIYPGQRIRIPCAPLVPPRDPA